MGSFSCEVTGTSIFPQELLPTPMISSQVVSQPSIEHPAQRLSRQRFSALALILRSRRCSDLVCFLRVFCRVDNVVGRRTLDPERSSARGYIAIGFLRLRSEHQKD